MIFHWVVADTYELIVCGSLWPGAKDGKEPPPGWPASAPVRDVRTGARKAASRDEETA